jgi:hypothetical protein
MAHFAIFLLVVGVWLKNAQGVSVNENYTICNWARLRAGVIRDAVYLDGGLLWWQTAFADGTTPVVSSDGNMEGDMFVLNFSTPFNTASTNVSGLFDRLAKAGGAGNNIAPNYIDGTMFANDGELYLYGGLPRLTNSASPQSSQSVLGYEAYQYGPDRSSWSPGFYQGTLPDGVSRYITNGAGVSVPSENLGFYFSGMRSPDWSPIYYEDSSANVTANTLIEADMSTMRDEKWTNTTLPDNITTRANAELVWIPVSDKGILIAIGGVTAPEEIWPQGLNASQTSESEAESPGFMTSLPIYDIANGDWYTQNTTGTAPPQLTEFCSVMAQANDSSSFNIYIYGGYNGLNSADGPSDDVWILSVPSFQWVKAYSGTRSHGRSGHKCVMPYPDQMFVIGGINQNQANCVEGGVVQIFNLNKLEFQDDYDPTSWSEYKVPDVVTKAIGGSSAGGAAKTATWDDNALGGIFAKPYARQIQRYYPYPANTTSSASSSDPDGSHGVSKGAIIAIAVAAAVIFLLLLILAFLLIRRRKIIRSGGSDKSHGSNDSRITKWLNGETLTKRPSPLQHQYSSSTATPQMTQVGLAGTGAAAGLAAAHNGGTWTSISSSSTPPVNANARYEMSNTSELPSAPYELATEYNDQNTPRHSGIVDYAYNANYGHTHAHHSNSNSNSSDEYRPSPLGNGNSQNAAALGAARGIQTGSDISPPSGEHSDNKSESNYSTSTAETPPWPLPASQNNWRGHARGGSRTSNRNPFASDHDGRSSESSSIQPIMEEDEAVHNPGTTRRQYGGENDRFSYQHGNESESSGVGTLPSPIRENEVESHGEGQRRSLMETISPISPDVKRFWQQ